MWATGAKLDEAFDLFYYWGLDYVTCLFVYSKSQKGDTNKLHLGFGYYTRSQCEFLLLARRGTIGSLLRKGQTVP